IPRRGNGPDQAVRAGRPAGPPVVSARLFNGPDEMYRNIRFGEQRPSPTFDISAPLALMIRHPVSEGKAFLRRSASEGMRDRKSVVKGKSVSVRVDLGGCR